MTKKMDFDYEKPINNNPVVLRLADLLRRCPITENTETKTWIDEVVQVFQQEKIGENCSVLVESGSILSPQFEEEARKAGQDAQNMINDAVKELKCHD